MKYIIILLFIGLFSCECEDCGEATQSKIELKNSSSHGLTISATEFVENIAVNSTKVINFTNRAGEAIPSSLTYESIAIVFEDGKQLTYLANVSVIVDGKERNPLTSGSYNYQKVGDIHVYTYEISQDDYTRAQ